MLIQTILGSIAVGSIAGIYKILKNSKDAEDKEIIVENITKYEYYPVGISEIDLKDKNIIKYKYIEGEKDGIKAFIGKDLEDNLKVFDILEGHAIVGGASRWGKSSFLNVFITSIMKTYTDNEVCFIGCDYKKSDIYYFRKYKHFKGMSTDKKTFMNQLDRLDKVIKERADILDKVNCRNVINYNKKHDKKMSYIIFVIDELIQVVSDKESRERLHTFMSKCASYGIYFILASQDCTKEVIGRCKMNCSQIIGFHTFDSTDSDTLIGKNNNLQDITVKGRCKIKNSEGISEVQIFYLEEDEIERLLKHNLKN